MGKIGITLLITLNPSVCIYNFEFQQREHEDVNKYGCQKTFLSIKAGANFTFHL